MPHRTQLIEILPGFVGGITCYIITASIIGSLALALLMGAGSYIGTSIAKFIHKKFKK